jgi:hypothetical protein
MKFFPTEDISPRNPPYRTGYIGRIMEPLSNLNGRIMEPLMEEKG